MGTRDPWRGVPLRIHDATALRDPIVATAEGHNVTGGCCGSRSLPSAESAATGGGQAFFGYMANYCRGAPASIAVSMGYGPAS